MNMNKQFNRSWNKAKQAGFTLIEMAIVVVIIGILAYVASRAFGTGVTGGAKATGLYEATNKITQSWSMLATQAGQSTVIASSPLPDAATSKTPEDVVFRGQANIATAYQSAWTQGGLIALADMAQVASGGGYTVSGHKVTLGGGGNSPLSVTFEGVPEDVALQIVQKHGSGVSALVATGDSTNNAVRYSAVTGGLTNVTIFKAI